MSFLTYLIKTLFFRFAIYGNEFFSFLYIKSKPVFKPPFQPLSNIAERLKIRVLYGLYYQINLSFIIFQKLLRHQPGTQKLGATSFVIFSWNVLMELLCEFIFLKECHYRILRILEFVSRILGVSKCSIKSNFLFVKCYKLIISLNS